MEQFYSVTLNEKNIGKVSVWREGLYYCFFCRCDLDLAGLYRLMVLCEKQEIRLGILVPFEGAFILKTKYPIKKIGEGNLKFRIVSANCPISSPIMPVIPEEPFAYISRLKESFLVFQDGQQGITMK